MNGIGDIMEKIMDSIANERTVCELGFDGGDISVEVMVDQLHLLIKNGLRHLSCFYLK